MSKSLCNRASVIKNTILFSLEKNSLTSLWLLQKKRISVSWWRRFYPFSLEPGSSAWILDKFKSRTKSLRSPCVDKWGSDDEQFASNVGSQSTLSPSCCPWSSSYSELSSLKVRLSESLVQAALHCVGQAHCRWQIWTFHCAFGFGDDPCYVC